MKFHPLIDFKDNINFMTDHLFCKDSKPVILKILPIASIKKFLSCSITSNMDSVTNTNFSLCSVYTACIYIIVICDRILENSSKSQMKSSVFLHVFNDISTYAYVFTEYFLHFFSNSSIEFHVVL